MASTVYLVLHTAMQAQFQKVGAEWFFVLHLSIASEFWTRSRERGLLLQTGLRSQPWETGWFLSFCWLPANLSGYPLLSSVNHRETSCVTRLCKQPGAPHLPGILFLIQSVLSKISSKFLWIVPRAFGATLVIDVWKYRGISWRVIYFINPLCKL